MPANEQAYTGFAGLQNLGSEWNRLDFAVRSILNQTATTTLVQVKAVSGSTMTGFAVDVQPMVSQVDGAGNAVPHGTIHAMPVWRVQGGISAVIVQPAVGDIGVAVFASSDISGVKRSGAPTTPGSARRYDWADGIYLGGLYGTPTQTIVMDAAGVTITSAGTVTIDAPTLAVTGDITTGAGSTFNGKSFDNHTHSGVTTGSDNSGPPV
jgi:hypothetical protein